MDGEVAQLAALAISANHRVARPDDPMRWFAGQRAFAGCGRISFHAAQKRRFGGLRQVQVAQTPSDWLDRLIRTGVARVILTCTRQDEDMVPGETLPDRIAAGFAGGGSLWTMSTETPDGGTLAWRPGWRAAFPEATDGRIWAVEYLAEPAGPADPGPDLAGASEDLRGALSSIRDFAQTHHFPQVAAIFTSALCLLAGEIDPRPVPRPVGPADTLSDSACCLLYAAQRAWVFDNLGLWKDQDFSPDLWKRYAGLSETLYGAVTAAILAAVNASIPKTG